MALIRSLIECEGVCVMFAKDVRMKSTMNTEVTSVGSKEGKERENERGREWDRERERDTLNISPAEGS